MNTARILATFICLSISLLVLVACSTSDLAARAVDDPRATENRESRIAAYFVSALVQVPELEPARTTLVASPRERRSPLMQSFRSAALDAGYRFVFDWETGGARDLVVRRARRRSAEGTIESYELSIGTIDMRRSFRLRDGFPEPAGPLLIHGTATNNIVADDDILTEPERSGGVGTRYHEPD